MSKFATQPIKKSQPLVSIESAGETVTHHGAPAFSRTPKSDLFLLGVSNFVSEDTFYEGAATRDERFVNLVHEVTKSDPDWVADFITYLRGTANMRSAAAVAAVEYVRAGGPNGRKVVASAIQRADEPAEVLAYFMSTYGRAIPNAIKDGVADGARRVYNERSFIKYDGSNRPFRWADVLKLAHVKPNGQWQSSLFKAALDTRFGAEPDLSDLPMIASYRKLTKDPNPEAVRDRLIADPELLKNSGMTWESLSSFGKMDKDAWEAIIPQMGYMALLRNLRNFDEAGVSDEVAAQVAARLADPEEVDKSRQLIFRFYSAYKNAPSLRWAWALEKALDRAVKNIPALGGSTLVLVDTSGSMSSMGYSARSSVTPVQAAALFGTALALSGQDATLRIFASSVADHKFPKGASVLSTADSLVKTVGKVGHGTNIGAALDSWNGQDRVVLITDMQTHDLVARGQNRSNNDHWYYGTEPGGSRIPLHVPIYGFNLQGYSSTIVDNEHNMYEFGGLTDSTFTMLKSIEAARTAHWPWNA
jgi:hypothetical protein